MKRALDNTPEKMDKYNEKNKGSGIAMN